jgi:beta-phosphoglucomutase-like phosphatase (HAD superfamily)
VARGKPAPDVFYLAAERLGIRPTRCAVVEDGTHGMEGAKAAGMQVIGLVPDPEEGDYPADILIASFEDTTAGELLDRLEAA